MALVVGATVIALSAWAAFFAWSNRPTARTHAQFTAKDVEAALFELVNPDARYHDTFDEFLAWPINDPYLESIRQESLKICAECPPAGGKDINEEGEKRIVALLRDLRHRTHLADGSAGSHSDAL